MGLWNDAWRQEGSEPDYRFSFANERTFLAWIRTALALLAAVVLLVQFAHRLQPQAVVVAVALGFALLAALLCAMSYSRWRANEIAMRHARALPDTPALRLTVLVLGVRALAVGALLVKAA